MFTPTAPATSKLLLIVLVSVFVPIVFTSLFILSVLSNFVITIRLVTKRAAKATAANQNPVTPDNAGLNLQRTDYNI